MNTSSAFATLGLICAAGLWSGCSGSDSSPIVAAGPAAASVDDRRTPQTDALTGAEQALATQAESEPAPPTRPDL
ncbi:MAG: hypothetical protein LZF86_110819 [Nitrospira sp.]|nr:MAG: hypothetical protein LZF86_110819 [Nitrospira sp.]